MMHRRELLAILIVVTGTAAILVYFAVHTLSVLTVLQAENAVGYNANGTLSGVDTSAWQVYGNPAFGFTVRYPDNWQISTAGLSANTPFIVLGNPLTGTTTYAIYISILQNPDSLSSGDFVHRMLTIARAQDAANAKSGPAPTVTPQFTHAYVTSVGTGTGYELYDVFEFDHNAEQIFTTKGNIAIKFDFPVSDDNPNLASPANNNAIAHMIVNTLNFE